MAEGWLNFAIERQARPASAVMSDMGRNAQSVPAGSVLPADLGYGIGAYIADIDFTSVDYNTVSWAAGNVRWASGITQAIGSGSADLTATHYFYVIYGNGTLQSSTTYSDAIGIGRVLVAVASIGSAAGINAYVMNPHSSNIMINRDKVMDGLVNALKLASDAVEEAKIKASAVTAGKIATGAVTTVKLDALAVTTEKIDAGAVTAEKISVATLSAITADIGTITAGLISGVTITAGTGNNILTINY